ncbi:hypothetical protein QL285_029912 [Trifolium repens]|nr:hypothetical protein QL285_029912 [Trifolium repens]
MVQNSWAPRISEHVNHSKIQKFKSVFRGGWQPRAEAKKASFTNNSVSKLYYVTFSVKGRRTWNRALSVVAEEMVGRSDRINTIFLPVPVDMIHLKAKGQRSFLVSLLNLTNN